MSWEDILKTKEERKPTTPKKRTLSPFQKEMKEYYLKNLDKYINKVNTCDYCGVIQDHFGSPKMKRFLLEHWDSGEPIEDKINIYQECDVCFKNMIHEDGFTMDDPHAKVSRSERVKPTKENKDMANDIIQNMRGD
ncbi:MAG: hypothetical protein GOVbin556_69 [Prokaryotic dsDNA virus sp.]|nr:MAG: hypothetical protein GOVbin556_69 [Prokaryotic dsDNA virus sp.]|tara:strand:- start:1084 stop:1491 length:408 start_codon:yes stop_codon:yes gene_type:complete